MPPRKRSSAAANSSKKSNPPPSQPPKFGIQHFFERHSQSQAAAATAKHDPPSNPSASRDKAKSNPTLSRPPSLSVSSQSNPNLPQPQTASINNVLEVSPEAPKSGDPIKRFKFSPGMIIKQSQDDGGDHVTWRISPVNERLQSLVAKSKGLPGITKIFSNPPVRPCSNKQNGSNCKGEIENWISSPTTLALYKSLSSTRTTVNSNNMDEQSPFRTPPSVFDSANKIKFNGDSDQVGALGHHKSQLKGDSDQLGAWGHRKALLELLDQVENVITDESVASYQSICEGANVTRRNAKVQPGLTQSLQGFSNTETFLVLEVFERHSTDSSCTKYPVKVLRLLNECSGQERAAHLYDQWFHSLIGPGDTVHVVGGFDDQGKCVIDNEANFVVVHPGVLLSGTRVASSFTCSRRAVLDERLKSQEHSTSALLGTMLHQIFQAGLLKELPTRKFLEDYARIVLQKNIESLYACGAKENDAQATLIEAIPRMLNWLKIFKGAEGFNNAIDFGRTVGEKTVKITEVMDIEEMAWAPRYGLKGMIDASVRVKMASADSNPCEVIMPLEFKSGKATSGQTASEHSAQVILYTLLMAERYLLQDIDSGLLYYLHTDETRGIKVRRSDLIGLIMRRNELAADLLKASDTQLLPPMLQNLTFCKGCRHINVCSIYHKAHGGDAVSAGLGDLYPELVEHLSAGHIGFLKHWDRLIDLEAKASQASRKELTVAGEHSTSSLSYVVLDCKSSFFAVNASKDGRFQYNFVRRVFSCTDFEKLSAKKLDAVDGIGHSDCTLKCGDHVMLSTVSGRRIASGIIVEISEGHVSISFQRQLKIPGDKSPSSESLSQQLWRIDKDEVASLHAVMRFNLIQLFLRGPPSSHLRKMIVDLEAPRFDSSGILSQDPAVSYIQNEKSLNDDQRRAIRKILNAKDYALILGMPGTGKTSTMVHAVKALLMRGSSILLTSYTNTAIDNLLIKLKDQGVDFVRIGRKEAVHNDVQECFFSTSTALSVEQIKQRMEHVRVVGVTCLGINHPLLANKAFDICIMDEAGQTTLPVSLGPLTLASTFVLVGDHYQLPPLVQSTEARENGMSKSLFCRLSEAHPEAIAALRCQYRMCAGIMELSNSLIYGNRLQCGSSEIANARLKFSSVGSVALWLNEVLDADKPVVFINTDLLPALEVKEHKALNNPIEAYIVAKIIEEMLKGGVKDDDIGVITPYNSQASLIVNVVDAHVEIHTIDKYQGRDKECIFVSFVRSCENSRANTSSLLGDWHRINVAITRAKKKLIMVGSCRTLSRVPLLKLLIEKVNEQGGMVHIPNTDFHQVKELNKC